MLTAITRAVSPAIVNCELSFVDRKPIDLAIAQEQHRAYEKLLGKLGVRVISLPAEPDLPDSMFVEDPAIVLDELAVILPLGTETRRREAPSLAQALAAFRKLEHVSLPGTVPAHMCPHRSPWLPRHFHRHLRTPKSRIRPHLLQSSFRKHNFRRTMSQHT